jgi:phosphoserine phosphatase
MSYLFLFDVDSTLIDQEVIELIAAHAGVQSKVKDITDRAMNGEIDFAQSLLERVGLLAELPESVIQDVKSEISLTFGAKELISELQTKGHIVAVISGGFTEVISELMQNLAIDNYRANSLEIENGRLTGKVKGLIVDRKAKAEYLTQLRNQFYPDKTFAIGDGANDIEMIQRADVGISFCGKEALNEIADVVILKRDLREVLNYL